MMNREKRQSLDGSGGFGGAAVGAQAASSEAAASDALREGMDLFLKKVVGLSRRPGSIRKGNLFEYIEAAKFNADAARKGVDARAYVTAEVPGRGTDPRVDIEVRGNDGKVLVEVQAKVSNDPQYLTREVANPQYDGTKKLVPKDQAGDVTAKTGDENVTGNLEHSEASSGGTTNDELKFATDHPKLYVLGGEILQVAREAGVAGLYAAGAGAVMGAAISSIRNVQAYSQGDIDGKQATKNVVADAMESSGRGGAAGALGSILRHGTDKVGIQTLTKSNVTTAVAAGVIDAGVTVYSYAKGEISAEVAAERLGDTGCSTLSGIYIGAAAGAVFGPAGAIVGSTAGYLLATSVYQSCIAVFKEARLAEEEAKRVVALCVEAVKVMDEQRERFEAALAGHLDERRLAFNESFDAIDRALDADQPNDAILALGDLTMRFGHELRLARFEDFDKCMTETDTPFRF